RVVLMKLNEVCVRLPVRAAVLGELFMKVLTEEEQVQQGAFLWGAPTADSQVGL
ncbi:hypothetical protein KUCAC02_000892, partial [Chaenocephalus aceratus]